MNWIDLLIISSNLFFLLGFFFFTILLIFLYLLAFIIYAWSLANLILKLTLNLILLAWNLDLVFSPLHFIFYSFLVWYLEIIYWTKDFDYFSGWFDDLSDELNFWSIVAQNTYRRTIFSVWYTYNYINYLIFLYLVSNWAVSDSFLLFYFFWVYIKDFINTSVFLNFIWVIWIFFSNTFFLISQFDWVFSCYSWTSAYFTFESLGWMNSPITDINPHVWNIMNYFSASNIESNIENKVIFGFSGNIIFILLITFSI